MSTAAIFLATFAVPSSIAYGSLKFLPTTLLRLTPIVSSTTSLIWAYDEFTSFSAWMDPAYRSEADSVLPAWFKNWAQKGNFVLLTSFPISLATGIANVLSMPGPAKSITWTSPRLWYGLGSFFALAHMFFGPRALGLLAEIQQKGKVDNEGKRASATDAMGRWLRMHTERTPITDLPALLCFVTAAVLGLEAK